MIETCLNMVETCLNIVYTLLNMIETSARPPARPSVRPSDRGAPVGFRGGRGAPVEILWSSRGDRGAPVGTVGLPWGFLNKELYEKYEK